MALLKTWITRILEILADVGSQINDHIFFLSSHFLTQRYLSRPYCLEIFTEVWNTYIESNGFLVLIKSCTLKLLNTYRSLVLRASLLFPRASCLSCCWHMYLLNKAPWMAGIGIQLLNRVKPRYENQPNLAEETE